MKKECRNLLLAPWFVSFSVALILVCGSAAPLRAQYTTARLSGIVSYLTGAVVAGATVTVQDVGTGYSQMTTSTDAGEYLFPSLPVGNYQIKVSAALVHKLCSERYCAFAGPSRVPECSTASGEG